MSDEPSSISVSDSVSVSLDVSTLSSAPLPIVVSPVYSNRRPFRCRMIGSVIGPVWNPLKLPAMLKRPMSPVQIAAFQPALIWQASPFKQRCLNRCHSHRPLAAFGIAADVDALRLGLETGVWCTASCWAAMLFPMLWFQGHFVAMAAVALLMFCERLDPPRTPAWRWRGFGTALRAISLRLRGPAPLTVGP